jgi:SAM-dependent methyltransferase
MHYTAALSASRFYSTYFEHIKNPNAYVVEIGSQDVNGSLRELCPSKNYTGVDYVHGKNVDVVLTNPYKLPFGDQSTDIVICSSVFEHSEMFWVTFLEIMRILKPHGLFYLSAPSNGDFHRWPVDCWRFYPDSGKAMVTWAKYNNINSVLLESYIGKQDQDIWNDFVAVFLKNESFLSKYPNRILHQINDYTNGVINGMPDFLNYDPIPEDRRR